MVVFDCWLINFVTHIEIVGKISKSILVFNPASVEICCPIYTALEYLKLVIIVMCMFKQGCITVFEF